MAILKGVDYDIDLFSDALVNSSIHEAFDFVSRISYYGIHSEADREEVTKTSYEISSKLCKEYNNEIAYAFDRIINQLMNPEKF